MMFATRMAMAVLGLAFVALVIWASATGDAGSAFLFLTERPWGIVTLADLYLGFVLMSVVIFVVEEDKRFAFVWIVPLYFVGNAWAALWLISRLGLLVRAMRGLAITEPEDERPL